MVMSKGVMMKGRGVSTTSTAAPSNYFQCHCVQIHLRDLRTRINKSRPSPPNSWRTVGHCQNLVERRWRDRQSATDHRKHRIANNSTVAVADWRRHRLNRRSSDRWSIERSPRSICHAKEKEQNWSSRPTDCEWQETLWQRWDSLQKDVRKRFTFHSRPMSFEPVWLRWSREGLEST